MKQNAMLKLAFLSLLALGLIGAGIWWLRLPTVVAPQSDTLETVMLEDGMSQETPLEDAQNPLSIEVLQNGEYPGSNIMIEETLSPGSNYDRYLTSYRSEGLKIYALLTVPRGTPPEGGWPAIVFNHGYIPPAQYRTTERYIAYTDAFSRNGYVLFRPDYRGHGNSEGEPAGGYGSNAYTIDVLNAVASLKQHPAVNKDKMGMWGHSMGGHITLRNMVASDDIKAGVIWAGVVASYPDLLNNWRRTNMAGVPSPVPGRSTWRMMLSQQFGTPEENPEFWNTISATSYLDEISGPLQIHHGTADDSVPVEFSETLQAKMEEAGKPSELFVYQGDDHNLSRNFSTAMRRSVEFFDRYLKE
jgi:dipeptidyl aminopeptidase/acylaminoacyl peptidase